MCKPGEPCDGNRGVGILELGRDNPAAELLKLAASVAGGFKIVTEVNREEFLSFMGRVWDDVEVEEVTHLVPPTGRLVS